MGSRDHRIDKINAYRKLLSSRKLPKFDENADKTLESELNDEFNSWVEDQISDLLGEKVTQGEYGVFTQSEVEFIKAFAARALAKAAPAPQANAQAVEPQVRINPDVRQKPTQVKPQAPRSKSDDSAVRAKDRWVRQLDQMEDDNNVPDFLKE